MFQENKGFTLIEILIVIFIIALLAGVSIISTRFFERGTELESAARNILSVIELARIKTLSSESDSRHGVHFETNKYVLFKGDVYVNGAADNKIYNLPSRLEIYEIALAGGGPDVIFDRISGATSQNGFVGLRIISEPGRAKVIVIDSSGRIEFQPGSVGCCTVGRLIDSRHLHLDLGWSIQGSNILTLSFQDTPPVITNINMTNYFNAGQTQFDWSGTIDVNGQNQELRIHTHFLDSINTILCLHRDRTRNNKPLQVLIDAKDIISYAADGTVTIDTYGGVPTIQ